MFLLGLLMKGLDKIDEARDAAIEGLIEETKQKGMPGGRKATSWGDVCESIYGKVGENGRKTQKSWETPQSPDKKSKYRAQAK